MQAAPERRTDPEDGEAYTREEFIEQYGGTAEWDAVGQRLQQARLQQQPQQHAAIQADLAGMAVSGCGGEVKRVDPEDGVAYTRAEFIDAYGGTAEWDAANTSTSGQRQQIPAPAPAPAKPQTRQEQIAAKKADMKARAAKLGRCTHASPSAA